MVNRGVRRKGQFKKSSIFVQLAAENSRAWKFVAKPSIKYRCRLLVLTNWFCNDLWIIKCHLVHVYLGRAFVFSYYTVFKCHSFASQLSSLFKNKTLTANNDSINLGN